MRKDWGLVYPFEKRAVEDIAVDTGPNVVIYTDGACSGNPGKGGWGAVLLANGKELRLSGGELKTTNNRMELCAAIFALKELEKLSIDSSRSITLYIDSQYVKNGITSWIESWKKNGWKTAAKEPVKNQDLWLMLDELNKKYSVQWKWVKGHAGNK
ncbi:MAG TPA: ribonuclease HI, partial [Treponemataceae bacterium]|nr:ribonuclease HI [Treponemataceae bacterium]